MKKKLSVNDFTNWIAQQDMSILNSAESKKAKMESATSLIGKTVFLKVSPKKLYEKAELQDGENDKKVFHEFKIQGGEVVEYVGKNLLIKTDSGSFLVPRFCVTE